MGKLAIMEAKSRKVGGRVSATQNPGVGTICVDFWWSAMAFVSN